MPRKKRPELTFQQHVADHLVRERGHGVLEQSDITDSEHFIAEDHRWAVLKATQADAHIGRKYPAEHSPGSGKTLSICWLADRLESLYQPGPNETLVDITFILTDRTALDDNALRRTLDRR
jgi:hypothetical protein